MKRLNVEPALFWGMVVLFLVGVGSFVVSSLNGNGHEDLVQNSIICALPVVILLATHFFNGKDNV